MIPVLATFEDDFGHASRQVGRVITRAERAFGQVRVSKKVGAQGRNRTTDTMIFNHVLYQLSYLGAGPAARRDAEARAL